jgi:H+/Cl- antiporter ClcA
LPAQFTTMDFHKRRRLVYLKQRAADTLSFNPFVFSRMFWLWVLLGILGGVTAGVYWIVLEEMIHIISFVKGLWVIPLMTLAGLLAGLVIKKLGDPGEIDLIVDNIKFKGGQLDAKNNPSMIMSSLLCISSGGSLGPEAPLVQVCGSIGTYVAKRFKMKGEDVRSLTIAGMAAAFTALFGSPLGGSLFAIEILHHKHVSQYYQAMIPAIVASAASFVVFLLITGTHIGPSWNFPPYTETTLIDLMYAVGFAMIATAVGWLFIYMVKQFKSVFKSLGVPIYLKLAIGGLILGLISYQLPITRYFGHEEITELLGTDLSLTMLFAILLGKLLAISITMTSGWRGGFIIPLFFVGTSLGLIINRFMPEQNVALIMVCCIASINACVTRTPISVIILLATMTGFHYFVPIMFASLTGFFLAPKTPLINAQLGEPEN